MRFDLVDLRLFLAVVDTGSITHGAAQVHLALASASERLRALEDQAGVQLFERRHRGVVVTEAGEAVAHHARLILAQRERLEGELRDYTAGRRGTVRLYANTSALADFLPVRLSTWLASRPGLNVDVRERMSPDIVAAIRAGRVEAGVISDAAEAEGLHLQRIAPDDLALVVPADHRMAGAESAWFADTLEEPFVGLAAGSALQARIEDHARQAGAVLNLRARMPTFDHLFEAVSLGVGLAIVPERMSRRLARRHRHRRLKLRDAWARRQLHLCHGDWASLSQPMRDLLLHLGARAPG